MSGRDQQFGQQQAHYGSSTGSPTRRERRGERADEDHLSTKVLVPAQSIGVVIGRQGNMLKQIRESCGVSVEVLSQENSPSWSNDRIVILRGPLASRAVAVEQVLKTVHRQWEGDCSFKLLLPTSKVGNLIGRGGTTLQALRQQCGVFVQVEREDIDGERLVTVQGPVMSVAAAVPTVLSVAESQQAMPQILTQVAPMVQQVQATPQQQTQQVAASQAQAQAVTAAAYAQAYPAAYAQAAQLAQAQVAQTQLASPYASAQAAFGAPAAYSQAAAAAFGAYSAQPMAVPGGIPYYQYGQY